MRQKIQSFIDNLAQLELTNDLQLTQRVFIAYEKHVKNKLREIISIPQEQEAAFIVSLEALLNEIWFLIKGTMLCYTAQPEHPVTLLMCEIARFVVENKKNGPPAKSPLGYLMPDMENHDSNIDIVNPISNNNGYPMLDELPIERVLNSHVLSQDGKYLLPVSLLLSEQYQSIQAQSDPVRNPYWNTEDYGIANAAFVSPPDLTKLEKHSNSTMAMAEAKRALCQAMDEKSHLLGHLRELVRSLTLNDVNHLGSEFNAAGGAYPAIIRFRDYYQSLTEKDNSSIPDEVKAEIEKLLGVAFDVNQNTNATENVETCIATRKDKLMSAMSGNDAVLSTIRACDESKAACIKKAKNEYGKAQESLKAALQAGGQYAGHDQLPITAALLGHLNLTFSISSYPDLLQLTLLTVGDLDELLHANKDLKTQVVDQLESSSALANFSFDLSCESLTVLLTQCGDAIVDNLTLSPQDFGEWLSPLGMDKCTAICEALRLKIPEMLEECYEFEYALEMLTLDKRTLVYQVMKDKLLKTIKTVEDFGRSLRHLTPAQCKAVCQDQQYKLLEIIKSGNDFGFFMWHLTSEQRTVVYEAMKEKLPEIIKSGSDFGAALHYLNPAQCTAVCLAMKERLPSILKDGGDFGQALKRLTPEECTAVCLAMKEKLPGILKDGSDFNDALRCLTAEQRTAVCKALQDIFPEIIKSGYDFGAALHNLNPAQCKAVCLAMKDRLPSILRDGSDFGQALEHLTPERCTVLCQAMQEKLPKIIKSGNDFGEAFSQLTSAQGTAVFKALRDKLPKIIKSGSDFGMALEHLTQEQRTAVYSDMKTRLPQMIKNASDFRGALDYLTPDQRTVVYKAMEGNIASLIFSGADVGCVLRHLTSEQCIAVCKTLENKLPALIDYYDINKILEYFTASGFIAVFQGRSTDLTNLIHNAGKLGLTLAKLGEPGCVEVCKLLQDRIPEIIKNPDDIVEVIKILKPQALVEKVCLVLNHRFIEIIKSGMEIGLVLRRLLHTPTAVIFIISLREKLPEIIKNIAEFEQALLPQVYTFNGTLGKISSRFTELIQSVVYDAMKYKLPDMIKSGEDLRRVLFHLNLHQRNEVYEAVKNKLSGIIQDGRDF